MPDFDAESPGQNPEAKGPVPEAARAALARVVQSAEFNRSARLQRFLNYIVEEALAGRSDALKEYTIGIEVFERDASFDPQTSSIVRVEASRLRSKLEKYNAIDGKDDPVHIRLRQGSYAPVFIDNCAPDQLISTQTDRDSLLSRPAVAVLPFTNMSGDPEQEYFADGLTEDIITVLSQARTFPVIARNSTFTYKNKPVRVQQVAEELGARYVLEGSVRKADNRVRVTAQLIDGRSGNHIWANRYDRDISDIFALQDDLTIAIVGAVEPEMGRAEQERVRRRVPDNMDVWDLHQQGMSHLRRRTKEDLKIARGLFQQGLALDPDFAPIYAAYSRTYSFDILFGFSDTGRDEARRAARKAVELDLEHADGHLALSTICYIENDFEQAIAEVETAVRLNPSYAAAHHLLGTILVHSGRSEEALPHLFAAIRLSPRDSEIAPFHARTATALLYLGRYDEAVTWGAKAVRMPGVQWPGHCAYTAALAHLDRVDEAKVALEELLSFRPGITQSFVHDHLATINERNKACMLAGLDKAGLPK